MTLTIVYWSGTGNTEAMANLVAEGAQDAGLAVNTKSVDRATADDLTADVLALGCPAMGDEVLEEGEFEPWLDTVLPQLAGRKVALFGSYDWGDGQWMRDWTKRMTDAGVVLAAESLIVHNTPDGDDAERCRAFGRSLA